MKTYKIQSWYCVTERDKRTKQFEIKRKKSLDEKKTVNRKLQFCNNPCELKWKRRIIIIREKIGWTLSNDEFDSLSVQGKIPVYLH